MPPPLLMLDVDGVLALGGAVRADDVDWHEVVSSAGETHRVGVRSAHRRWVRRLAEHFEVVWATGWEHDAPRLLGPLLDLPVFPVLEFTQRPALGVPLRKTPDVARLVGDRPTAWVDDDLDQDARRWAERRAAPTLLVVPDPAVGLTEADVDELVAFAVSLE